MLEQRELTVEEKFGKLALSLRLVRPFYALVFSRLKKIECEPDPASGFSTLGTNMTSLIYTRDYMESCTMENLAYVCLHEIAHISLMHPVRRERRNRILFNIACDMYVNELLFKEFSAQEGDLIRVFTKGSSVGCEKVSKESKREHGLYIEFPSETLRSGFKGVTFDLETSSVEEIYAMLRDKIDVEQEADGRVMSYNKESSKGSSPTPQGDGQQGSQPSQGDGQQGNATKQGMGHQGDNQSGVGTGQNGAPAHSSGSSGSTQPPQGDDITDLMSELMQASSGAHQLSERELENVKSEIRRMVRECAVQSKMQVGDGGCLLERKVDSDVLAPKVDWRKMLSRYLVDIIRKETSFATVDTRCVSWNAAILPGFDSPNGKKLERVKIGIDTSGSISDKDMGIFMKQINQLLTRFRVSAEMLYWDTMIESRDILPHKRSGSRKDKVSFQNAKGGGGTDPSCLFEYFDSKGCKVKPKVTIVFTDGYINFRYANSKASNLKKYRDTIWVITPDGNKDFKPPFGKVAKFISKE